MGSNYFFENSQHENCVQVFSPTPASDESKTANWSWDENKFFEKIIGDYAHLDDPHSQPHIFADIASKFPGKTIMDIEEHFKVLCEDINIIESAAFSVFGYETTDNSHDEQKFVARNPVKRVRRKATIWTCQEHRDFLSGLAEYGKGDWKSISRFCVKTKSPSQIASHAQKHFLKIEKEKNEEENVGEIPTATATTASTVVATATNATAIGTATATTAAATVSEDIA